GGFGASGEHSAAYRCLCNIASYLWDTTLGLPWQINASHGEPFRELIILPNFPDLLIRQNGRERPRFQIIFQDYGGELAALNRIRHRLTKGRVLTCNVGKHPGIQEVYLLARQDRQQRVGGEYGFVLFPKKLKRIAKPARICNVKISNTVVIPQIP